MPSMFSHSRQGAVDVIAGSVPLDVESCERFRTFVEERLHRGQPKLVINLGGFPFIDSRGLETILEIRDRCHGLGGECKLASPNPLCRDILFATGLDAEFEIVADVIEGAGSFAL